MTRRACLLVTTRRQQSRRSFGKCLGRHSKGGDVAKRPFEATMKMQKIDVAKIEAAVRREAVVR